MKETGRKNNKRVNERLPEEYDDLEWADDNDHPQENRSPIHLEFDFEEFAQYVIGLDLSEEEAREALGALWSILIALSDLGFGIHPAQKACGISGKDSPSATLASLFTIECKDSLIDSDLIAASHPEAVPEESR